MWPYPWTHVGTPSHLGHMDRVAATMPSQAHAGAAQEAPDIGQWEGQDVPLVRPSSCNVKGGIPSSRRYLPTYLNRKWQVSGQGEFTIGRGMFPRQADLRTIGHGMFLGQADLRTIRHGIFLGQADLRTIGHGMFLGQAQLCTIRNGMLPGKAE